VIFLAVSGLLRVVFSWREFATVDLPLPSRWIKGSGHELTRIPQTQGSW